MAVTLYLCQTCRMGQPVPEDGVVPGERLLNALRAGKLPADVRLEPVSCLSACSHGCAVALARPGSWTYVQGGLGPDDIDELLTMARQYAETCDGIVPWRERSVLFRKNTIARIPPFPTPSSPAKDRS